VRPRVQWKNFRSLTKKILLDFRAKIKIISCCFIDFLTAAVHKTQTRLKIHVSSIFSASLALTSVIKITKKYCAKKILFQWNDFWSFIQQRFIDYSINMFSPKLISRFFMCDEFFYFHYLLCCWSFLELLTCENFMAHKKFICKRRYRTVFIWVTWIARF
jgi:hypothetical protein